MEIKSLELKRKHFKNTEYMCNECAIGKAFLEATGIIPTVGVGYVATRFGTAYSFRDYTERMFKSDKKKAEISHYTKVIRKIKLEKNG